MTIKERSKTDPQIEYCPRCGMRILVDKPKRGKWIFLGGYQLCSNCSEVKRCSHWNFCPNCGADMREREND